jgi:Myb-like DNA-binding domain
MKLESHKKIKNLSKNRPKKEKRRPWTIKEDDWMKKLVQENGTKQWTIIAEKLNHYFPNAIRTGKQCRERWHNHLNPGINKDCWSLDEEIILFSTHSKLGNKWAEISTYLPGRTDNSIKNHFYSTLRKQYRMVKGSDSTRDQLKKHCSQLAASILASLKKKQRKREDQEFIKSQEDFFDCFPAMPCSPPDFDEDISYSNCEFIVYGHQIDLPQSMSKIEHEEAPMEFSWLDSNSFPDEVFLMPLNTSEI